MDDYTQRQIQRVIGAMTLDLGEQVTEVKPWFPYQDQEMFRARIKNEANGTWRLCYIGLPKDFVLEPPSDQRAEVAAGEGSRE